MKTFNTVISGIAIALAMGLANATHADQPGMRQRAAANHFELSRRSSDTPKVSSTQPNPMKERITGRGKAWAQFHESRKPVVGGGPSIDLAHAPRPITASKDPDFEKTLRENARKQFEIAPLK